MPDESRTPDAVELFRRGLDAANRRDFDAVLALFAPGSTWDVMLLGRKLSDMAAIRGFLEDWLETFEGWEAVVEDVVAVGDSVTLGVFRQMGQPRAGSSPVGSRIAMVALWRDGRIVRAVNFTDMDDARAMAEQLAQERG